MNVYFLVEGKRTEKKVYPKWLSLLVPDLTRVSSYDKVEINNYYIFSGNGFPSLLDNHLRHSIEDVNFVGKYDYFVICLDSDEQSIQECKDEIFAFLKKEKIDLNPNIKFEIIVQNKCLETWFLGNTNIFKKNPNDKFIANCTSFYNVKTKDPEKMNKLPDFNGSTSIFHFAYLRGLLAERNILYSKEIPRDVVNEYYLEQLIQRNKETGHIQSFKYFIDFCEEINRQLR